MVQRRGRLVWRIIQLYYNLASSFALCRNWLTFLAVGKEAELFGSDNNSKETIIANTSDCMLSLFPGMSILEPLYVLPLQVIIELLIYNYSNYNWIIKSSLTFKSPKLHKHVGKRCLSDATWCSTKVHNNGSCVHGPCALLTLRTLTAGIMKEEPY